MRLLTPSGARSFCQSFSGSPRTSDVDVAKYLDSFRSGKLFKEGTRDFEDLRDCLLRDAERQAFLAAGNFATVHRGLQAGVVGWSVVGLYYSSYFAARSLLSMHGGWVDANRRWVGLTDTTAGGLEFTYFKSAHPSIPRRLGTHKAFWSVFYHATTGLHAHADPAHAYALSPVQSSTTWLIDKRNEINYNAAAALKLTSSFTSRYDPGSIPTCFPGELKVYKNVANSLLALVAQFRIANGLSSDLSIGGTADLNAAITDLIRQNAPEDLRTHCQDAIAQFAA